MTALASLFAPNREWLVSEPQEWRPGPRGQPCTPRMAGQCVWWREGRGAALRSSFPLCPISELQLGAQKCPPAPRSCDDPTKPAPSSARAGLVSGLQVGLARGTAARIGQERGPWLGQGHARSQSFVLRRSICQG